MAESPRPAPWTAGWSGILQVDKPRHRTDIDFTRDWPGMNAMPEWLTAEPDED